MQRCDVLDLVEAAIVRATPLAVELADGTSLVDRPIDLAAHGGEDHVTFARGAVVAVGAIRWAGEPGRSGGAPRS